ncbi:Katanin p60 ATPase-containing subunit A-like 2, partial [Chytriomyces hyalinus]
FGKPPKLVKKCDSDACSQAPSGAKKKPVPPGSRFSDELPSYNENHGRDSPNFPKLKSGALTAISGELKKKKKVEPANLSANASLSSNASIKPHSEAIDNFEIVGTRLILTNESDIYMENPNVHWADIAGLTTSKRLVREAVVYPLRFPE